ncbi:MAG: AI-2E family transporter [Flavobacterium sp.]|nr:AI-2E family transporter [Flavobacterium sp.]
MINSEENPLYIKIAFSLIIILSIGTILYCGKEILMPIFLSFLFAIMLQPIVVFFNKKLRFPHILAIIFTLTLFVAILSSLFYFVSIQVSDIINDWTKIKTNFYVHLEYIQHLIKDNFNLSKRDQKQILDGAKKDGMKQSSEIVGSTLLSFSDFILTATLIPIYTFLILLYRIHFIKFFCKLFNSKHHTKLQEILFEIKVVIQSYVVGLIIEMIGVSILTTIGLYFIGIEYFILLGIITGVLNLIPYVGILFAGILTIVVSLSGTTDFAIVLYIIGVNFVVQLIDNNIFVPLFVNSKVSINAFVSIIGIIIGNIFGGITGMFLAIPIIAILKVIFDRIEGLESWGYLFGDDLPKTFEWRRIKIPMFKSDNTTSSQNFEIFIKPKTEDENVEVSE